MRFSDTYSIFFFRMKKKTLKTRTIMHFSHFIFSINYTMCFSFWVCWLVAVGWLVVVSLGYCLGFVLVLNTKVHITDKMLWIYVGISVKCISSRSLRSGLRNGFSFRCIMRIQSFFCLTTIGLSLFPFSCVFHMFRLPHWIICV